MGELAWWGWRRVRALNPLEHTYCCSLSYTPVLIIFPLNASWRYLPPVVWHYTSHSMFYVSLWLKAAGIVQEKYLSDLKVILCQQTAFYFQPEFIQDQLLFFFLVQQHHLGWGLFSDIYCPSLKIQINIFSSDKTCFFAHFTWIFLPKHYIYYLSQFDLILTWEQHFTFFRQPECLTSPPLSCSRHLPSSSIIPQINKQTYTFHSYFLQLLTRGGQYFPRHATLSVGILSPY